MTDQREKMREALEALTEPEESDAYDNLESALIDIKRLSANGKPTDHVCIRTIERVQDQILKATKIMQAALTASGKKSDGSRVRQVDNARSHGEGLQYGPDTTITTGTDAPSIAAKVRDDGNVANQVETSGRAPHVLLGPSDPIPSPSAPPLSAPVRRLKGGCDG